MRIETICENRKELVKAMAEILGEPSKYLGPPSFGYQIGVQLWIVMETLKQRMAKCFRKNCSEGDSLKIIRRN